MTLQTPVSFDPHHLMRYEVPAAHVRWGAADCALYALSLGMSLDPLDKAQLGYTAGLGGPNILPFQSLVLATGGFWAGNPATGIDALKLVHGEEAIEFLHPLPPEGEAIGQVRILGLEDKGAGKGALMYTERSLTDATSGVVYAKIRRTSFLRGNGGFGGQYGQVFRPQTAPEGTPDQVITLPVQPNQALLYRWNGDHNPLHYDPDTAAKAGFRQPILHGLCTLGMAAQALLGALAGWDASRLRGLSARFTAVVYPGETLAVEIWNSGAFRVRVIERDVIVLNNGLMRLSEANQG